MLQYIPLRPARGTLGHSAPAPVLLCPRFFPSTRRPTRQSTRAHVIDRLPEPVVYAWGKKRLSCSLLLFAAVFPFLFAQGSPESRPEERCVAFGSIAKDGSRQKNAARKGGTLPLRALPHVCILCSVVAIATERESWWSESWALIDFTVEGRSVGARHADICENSQQRSHQMEGSDEQADR